MIKKFYNSSDERFIKEQSILMFEEVSDGIYLVVKDRLDKCEKDFVTSRAVAKALNHIIKVAVVHKSGSSGYTNWNFEG